MGEALDSLFDYVPVRRQHRRCRDDYHILHPTCFEGPPRVVRVYFDEERRDTIAEIVDMTDPGHEFERVLHDACKNAGMRIRSVHLQRVGTRTDGTTWRAFLFGRHPLDAFESALCKALNYI